VPPAPPAPPTTRRPAIVPIAALLAVALVAAVAAAGLVLSRRDSGPRHPDEWDERVADLAAFVEGARGRDFDHPVHVDFLDDDDFDAAARAGGEVTDREVDDLAMALRALGMLDPDVDLGAVLGQGSADGILGFYDPTTERITVRGLELTVDVRLTLVHELTHALQDQHFDLGRPLPTSGEQFAWRALAEGDAMRIADAYANFLTEEERQEIEDALLDPTADPGADDGVPRFLHDLAGAPYLLGSAFVGLVAAGTNLEVDELFARPPRSEEHLALPRQYMANDRVASVAPPSLGPDEELVSEVDDFGMVSLLLVLAERVGFDALWPSLRHWAGDAMTTYRADGRECVRIAISFDEPAHRDAFLAPATVWAESLPGAAVVADGDLARIESCTTDDAPAPPPPVTPRPIDVLYARVILAIGAREAGIAADEAECMADAILTRLGGPGLSELAELDTNDPVVAEHLFSAMDGCGALPGS
jgi:hypothetical protein